MDRYKNMRDGNYDKTAVHVLERLKKRIELKKNLFSEQDARDFDLRKEFDPEANLNLETQEAFDNLTPSQKKQVTAELDQIRIDETIAAIKNGKR